MNRFRASVQYQDYVGTAAADHADNGDLIDFLKKNGLMNNDEFIIAASLFVGTSHGTEPGATFVKAYLFDKGDYDTVKAALDASADPIPVRVVDVAVPLEEFLSFFKRLSVVLTPKGLDIEGREHSEI